MNLNEDYSGVTKLKNWWGIVKSNFSTITTAFNGHVGGSTDKHASSDITYTGTITGATTVKGAVESVNTKHANHVSGTAEKHSASHIIFGGSDVGAELESINTNKLGKLEAGQNGKLTSYAKASSSAAIATTDSINQGLGKVEYKADNLGTAKLDKATAGQFGLLANYLKPANPSAITTSDSINEAIGKLEKGLEQADMQTFIYSEIDTKIDAGFYKVVNNDIGDPESTYNDEFMFVTSYRYRSSLGTEASEDKITQYYMPNPQNADLKGVSKRTGEMSGGDILTLTWGEWELIDGNKTIFEASVSVVGDPPEATVTLSKGKTEYANLAASMTATVVLPNVPTDGISYKGTLYLQYSVSSASDITIDGTFAWLGNVAYSFESSGKIKLVYENCPITNKWLVSVQKYV